MTGWSEALDARLEMRGWLASPARDEWVRKEAAGEPPEPRFFEGDAIWLAADVSRLAATAAETWSEEPLRPSDLLVARAFMLLEEPLPTLGVSLDEQAEIFVEFGFPADTLFRGIAWVSTEAAVYVHLLTNQHHGPGIPGLAFFGRALAWEYGHPSGELGPFAPYLQVLWRLAQQRITTHERRPADRPARRRAARAGCDDPYVTVITLRHTQRPREGEPSTVEWAHRWIVGGHWRNQWYASIGEHRQIWIAPHVKGPEDKDLRIRDARAFSFVR